MERAFSSALLIILIAPLASQGILAVSESSSDDVVVKGGRNHHIHEMGFESFVFEEHTAIPVFFKATNQKSFSSLTIHLNVKIAPPGTNDWEYVDIEPDEVTLSPGQTIEIEGAITDVPDGEWEVTICSYERPMKSDGSYDDCIWVNEPITVLNRFNWGALWFWTKCFGILGLLVGVVMVFQHRTQK